MVRFSALTLSAHMQHSNPPDSMSNASFQTRSPIEFNHAMQSWIPACIVYQTSTSTVHRRSGLSCVLCVGTPSEMGKYISSQCYASCRTTVFPTKSLTARGLEVVRMSLSSSFLKSYRHKKIPSRCWAMESMQSAYLLLHQRGSAHGRAHNVTCPKCQSYVVPSSY